METVRAIRTEKDYEAALARVSDLMDALSPPEGQIEDSEDPRWIELDVLFDLVEHYEDQHYPVPFPTPIAAIEFRMDQAGLTHRDLIPFIGSRAKVSEVLSGKRDISPCLWPAPSPPNGMQCCRSWSLLRLEDTLQVDEEAFCVEKGFD